VFEKPAGETPQINGDDYDTDGTNVRDYVHVGDIAAAHVVAAQRLESGATVEPRTTWVRRTASA
jgi:UDP-glucose 4-epimerase